MAELIGRELNLNNKPIPQSFGKVERRLSFKLGTTRNSKVNVGEYVMSSSAVFVTLNGNFRTQ